MFRWKFSWIEKLLKILKKKVDFFQILLTEKNVSPLLPIAKLQAGMDWCNRGCCFSLGNLRHLVGKGKCSTVMSDFQQKLSWIEAFKINDQHGHSNKKSVFFSLKRLQTTSREFVTLRSIKKVLNGGTSAWFSLCWSRLRRINKQARYLEEGVRVVNYQTKRGVALIQEYSELLTKT